MLKFTADVGKQEMLVNAGEKVAIECWSLGRVYRKKKDGDGKWGLVGCISVVTCKHQCRHEVGVPTNYLVEAPMNH